MSITDTLFGKSSLPVLEQVIGFTRARHGVLAGNIANLDTPGYVTRDLSPKAFEDGLRDAISHRSTASQGSHFPTQATQLPDWIGHFPKQGGSFSVDHVSDVDKNFRSILYHDQSDVAIEKQVAEISKNQARHNLALQIMVSQFRLLQTAISERVA